MFSLAHLISHTSDRTLTNSPTHSFTHRPYSRQVKEQLPLSGSFHSHQLVYLKASNAASSEIIDFLEVHFNLHCRCIQQFSFDQHHLCMFKNYITVCPEKIKNRKLCIWPIFTCINRTFDTSYPIHVNWLPLRVVRSRNSVYLFRCTFLHIRWAYLGVLTRKINSNFQRDSLRWRIDSLNNSHIKSAIYRARRKFALSKWFFCLCWISPIKNYIYNDWYIWVMII